MREIFISAGHSTDPKGDRGAQGVNGIWEGDLTVELRDLIVKELSALGIQARIDPNQNALSATLSFFKSLIKGNSIAIDIHWNAFNGIAKGCEVIIPEKPSVFEKNIALDILNTICKTTLITSRGVKTETQTARKRLGWMRQSCETILIEVCFIDNKQDMLLYNSNKIKLASNIANVIKNYLV